MKKYKFEVLFDEWLISRDSELKKIILEAISELPLEKLKLLFNATIQSGEDLISSHQNAKGIQYLESKKALLRGSFNLPD